MERYEYKVDYLEVKVTAGDMGKGLAGEKIVSQVEIKMREWVDKGYEYFTQNTIAFTIQPGCMALFGQKTESREMLVLVFRKPAR